MSKQFVCNLTEPIASTKAGKLRGFLWDGTYTFHGVKYADADRFQMPKPVKPWEGVKDALGYGYIAPLTDLFGISDDIMAPHRLWPENEHCQYLNVWTQSMDPGAKMPVIVWLHGGGFSVGSSIEQVAYEGANLSRYGNAVVVTLNHRLNILGYLDLSDFDKKYYNSGNSGMADIVEALRWIKDNIAAFGGDPDCVTVFGQSGGGGKVTALTQIPAAAGLFHRAIIMSGIADFSFGIERDDKAIVLSMLKELGLGAKDVKKLETLPYAQLLDAFMKGCRALGFKRPGMLNGPLANDWHAGDPLKVGFTENAKKIPTMAGTVIAEFAGLADLTDKESMSVAARREAIARKFGAAADELIRLFKSAYPDKNEMDVLAMDALFREPTLQYLEKKSEVASAPVYSYMFSLNFTFNGGKPAWHCADIPFAFHNCDIIPYTNVDGVTDRLEEEYCGAYVAFARTGNPNHKNLPHWPAFTAQNKATMVFDRKTEVRVDYERELLALLKKCGPAKPDFMNDED